VPTHRAMTPVVWDSSGAATIEFCQKGRTFGYRLVGEQTCGPAGVVIRADSGGNYSLTLRNNSTQSTNLHIQGLHVSSDGNANNIDRLVDPGKCISYYISIRPDHMGGLFLLHSNAPSQMAQQVRNPPGSESGSLREHH
jgi:FtsP/CotA-like multicopper oxidase with cupredoxin domain